MMFQLWIVGRDDGGGIGFFHVGVGVSLLCLFIWCHRFGVGGRDISSDCMVYLPGSLGSRGWIGAEMEHTHLGRSRARPVPLG